MKNKDSHPFYKIHKVNSNFNKCFSKPLYYLSFFVTILATILPHKGKIALAYFINIFFNRPVVYLSMFGKFVGQYMQKVVLFVFYILVFGIYGVLFQICKFLRPSQKGWTKVKEGAREDYFYQS